MHEYDPPDPARVPPDDPKPSDRPSGVSVFLGVGAGVAIVALAHAVIGGLLFGASSTATQYVGGSIASTLESASWIWLMGLPLVQLLYVLPAALVAWRVHRPIAMGMAIGALLTFLLATTCYGMVFMVATMPH